MRHVVHLSIEQAKSRDEAQQVALGIENDAGAGVVRLETADGTHAIPLANIDKARLVPKIEWRNAR